MQKILSFLRKGCEKYGLIEENDKIIIGVSGGKDSLLLLKAMKNYQLFSNKKFELMAVIIDIYSGKQDYSGLIDFCKEIDVPLHIEKTDIQSVVFDIRKESNPCSLCAKMRRGALCAVCNKFGYNKLALGHHLDDVINTFFLSLFYEGRINTMQPKSYMSNTNVTLIRPLFLCEEKLIVEKTKEFPILKSKCPADKNSKRFEMKTYLSNLYKQDPNCKKRLINAILSYVEKN